MRILVDTNVLVSALMFPHSKPAAALEYVFHEHEMVLCDQNISELLEVLDRKAPYMRSAAEELLLTWDYEIVTSRFPKAVHIRDSTDQPILDAALESDVDVILTGDKDFLTLKLDHPEIMTVQQLLTTKF